MQYLRENAAGVRFAVTDWEFLQDSQGPDKGNIVFLVREPGICIYHMQGSGHKPVTPKALKYGGRNRGAAKGLNNYNGA